MPFQVDKDNCQGCGKCIKACKNGAIDLDGGIAHINEHMCNDCEECLYECLNNAILYIAERENESA